MDYKEFEEKRNALENKINDLKDKYIASLPFKIGDKVRVSQFGKTRIGIINYIQILDGESMFVYYKPFKKDGKTLRNVHFALIPSRKEFDNIKVLNEK